MTTEFGLITVAGLVAAAGLTWLFIRLRTRDHLADLLKKRSGCKIAQVATFVEGMEEIPVALALDDRSLYYETPDMQANLDLGLVEEIEYDDELSTGKSVHNAKILRLRSHGHTFEFMVEKADAAKWMAALPARTYGSEQQQAV